MWNYWLCFSWIALRQVIWDSYWSLVSRSSLLWDYGWKMPVLSYKSKINDEKNYKRKYFSSIDWPIRYKVTIKYPEWNKRFHLQVAAQEPLIANECRECSAASINSKILWRRTSRHSEGLQKKVLNIFFIILLSSIENLNDFTSLYIIMVLIMDFLFSI